MVPLTFKGKFYLIFFFRSKSCLNSPFLSFPESNAFLLTMERENIHSHLIGEKLSSMVFPLDTIVSESVGAKT